MANISDNTIFVVEIELGGFFDIIGSPVFK